MIRPSDVRRRKDEPKGALWLAVAAPAVWILVFVIVYAAVAVACARGAPVGGVMGPVRYVAFAVTGAGLVAIVAIGVAGWRRIPPAGSDGDEGVLARERFIGWTTALLSGLSAVGTLYVLMTLALFGACR